MKLKHGSVKNRTDRLNRKLRIHNFIKKNVIMLNDSYVSSENIVTLTGPGGSNVGQLSNEAAIDLAREGVGKKQKF